jgi:hypothetical protein
VSDGGTPDPPVGPGRTGWQLPSGSTTPRPLGLRLGDAVAGIFRLYRRRPRLLLGISAIFEVPVLVLSVPLGPRLVASMTELLGFSPLDPPAVMPDHLPAFSPSAAADLAISLAVLIVVGMIVGALTAAAFTIALEQISAGRPATVTGTIRRLAPRMATLLAAQVGYLVAVGAVFVGGLVLVSSLIGLSPDPASGGALVFLGIVALVAVLALTIFLALRLGFWPQAASLEGVPALEALRRSWRLVSGSTWRVLGYAIALGLLDYLLTTLLAQLGSVVADLAALDIDAAATLLLAWNLVVTVIVAPVVPLGMTMLFFDLRRQSGGTPPPETPPA